MGTVMLAAALKSRRAVEVSVLIVKAFIRMRRMLTGQRELRSNWRNWRASLQSTTRVSKVVFDAIRKLMQKPEPHPKPSRQIGFHVSDRPGETLRRSQAQEGLTRRFSSTDSADYTDSACFRWDLGFGAWSDIWHLVTWDFAFALPSDLLTCLLRSCRSRSRGKPGGCPQDSPRIPQDSLPPTYCSLPTVSYLLPTVPTYCPSRSTLPVSRCDSVRNS